MAGLDPGVRPDAAGGGLLLHPVIPQEGVGRARRHLGRVDERDVLGAGDREEQPHGEEIDRVEPGPDAGLGDGREVAGGRLMDHPGQQRARLRAVEGPADAVRHHVPGDLELDGLLGLRILDLDRHGLAPEAVHHRLEFLPEFRELAVAGGVLLAPGRELVHRHGAHQDDRAHLLGMAPREVLPRPRAVGAANDVDLAVAQPSQRLGEVVHGGIGGVAGEVVRLRQALLALPDGRDREHLPEIALQVVLMAAELAGQLVRLRGAALIDEDEIAVAAQRDFREIAGLLGDRLAGAAAEEEDRIGLRRRRERRQDDHLHADLAARLRLPVLPDLIGGAAGVDRPLLSRDLAGLELGLGRLRRRLGGGEGREGRERQGDN